METFVNELMNKSDYRKWIIYNELNLNKDMNNKLLARLCGCTAKTFWVDIQEIKDELDEIDGMPTIQVRKDNIFIKQDQVIPLNNVLLRSILKSNHFKVFKEVSEAKNRTIKQFSKSQYLSPTTIYKSIKKLNTILSPFNLHIANFKLTGDEYKIRIFLFHFYWTVFGGVKWPFKAIDENECEEHVYKIENKFSEYFTWIEKKKVSFWVAISILRSQVNEGVRGNNISFYWKSLDAEVYEIIKKLSLELPIGTKKEKSTLLLVILFLICDSSKLKINYLNLSNFSDPVSKSSLELLNKVSKMDNQSDWTKQNNNAQKELIKFAHYSKLGEAYVPLIIKKFAKMTDTNFLPIDYLEESKLEKKQVEIIYHILKKQNLVKNPKQTVFIGAKYGDGEMNEIKDIMEAFGGNKFNYVSLWNENVTNKTFEVVLTDVEKIPLLRADLFLQFNIPFDEKQAYKLLLAMTDYFKSKV